MSDQFFRITIKTFNKLGWPRNLNNQVNVTGPVWTSIKSKTCGKTFIAKKYIKDQKEKVVCYKIENNRYKFSYISEYIEDLEEITNEEFHDILKIYKNKRLDHSYED